MHSLVKGIILSVWIWFIIKVSEKSLGNTKHQIQKRIFLLFYMAMASIWRNKHFRVVMLQLVYRITDIVIAILCLFSDISKELLGACWVTSLIVVLFVSGGSES